jgi:cytochrome c-type biogenesis protein CcmH
LADPAQEARALELMQRLRCIQCQGQSIHDSDAPIAAAMRHEVRERIKAGQSEAEIESWLIERYGDWISFAPPASGGGWCFGYCRCCCWVAQRWSRAVVSARTRT